LNKNNSNGIREKDSAGQKAGRLLFPQLTYRLPYIGRKACRSTRRRRCTAVNVPHEGLCQGPLICGRLRPPISLRSPVKRLSYSSHFLWHCEIAYTHFPQILVHVLAKSVKQGLPQFPEDGVFRQPVQHRGQEQYQKIKTAIQSVRDAEFPVKAGQSRLRHDRAIQGRNGVLPRVAAKQGKHHRIGRGCGAVRRSYVKAFLDARQKRQCRVGVEIRVPQ